MRSDLHLGLLLGAILLLPSACAMNLDDAPGANSLDASGGIGFEFQDESWRPPSPFIAGTALIPLSQPLRCRRYPLDPALVAFTWEPSGQRRVYAAIYGSEPVRQGNEVITRPEWTWMTGGSRSDVGRLHWGNGAPPDARNLPDFQRDPPALVAGSHWFAIWAWDESRNLVASSEARLFFVDPDAQSRLELATCCEQVAAADLKATCAPLLPPENGSCPGGSDAGVSVAWPCFCAFEDAGEICVQ